MIRPSLLVSCKRRHAAFAAAVFSAIRIDDDEFFSQRHHIASNASLLVETEATTSSIGHASFFISDLVPQSANELEMIQLLNATGVVTGIGLRFSPLGSFTSVPFIS